VASDYVGVPCACILGAKKKIERERERERESERESGLRTARWRVVVLGVVAGVSAQLELSGIFFLTFSILLIF
jgi:hypothetical protein